MLYVNLFYLFYKSACLKDSQWAIICSKLAVETLEQGVKYVQS